MNLNTYLQKIFLRIHWADLLILSIGIILHIAQTRYVLNSPLVENGMRLWEMPDTGSYVGSMEALSVGKNRAPVFHERVLLPVLMRLTEKIGLPYIDVLWFVVAMHIPVALIVSKLAFLLTGVPATRRIALILYFIWPSFYEYTPLLATDMLQAQFSLLAIGFTILWKQNTKSPDAIKACTCWLLAQLMRPTFFMVAPLLILYLVPRLRNRSTRYVGMVLVASTLIVPLLMSSTNLFLYGLFKPCLSPVDSLYCNVLPRIRTLQKNEITPVLLTSTFFYEREVVAKADERWKALCLYQSGAVPPHFKENYESLRKEGVEFIHQHRIWFWRSAGMELIHQLTEPPLFRHTHLFFTFTPGMMLWVGRWHKIILAWSLIATLWLLRSKPDLALFIILLSGLVLSASAFLWWYSTRLRLPVEMMLLPVITAAFFQRHNWIALFMGVGIEKTMAIVLGAAYEWALLTGALGAFIYLFFINYANYKKNRTIKAQRSENLA